MTNTTKTNTQIRLHILDKSLVKTGIVITTNDITQTSIDVDFMLGLVCHPVHTLSDHKNLFKKMSEKDDNSLLMPSCSLD